VVGTRVEVEAFYDDDTPAGNARVAVRDGAGKRIADGRTDAQGRWTFDRPPAGQYEVAVDAGGGHRKTVKISVPAAAPAGGETPAGNSGPGESTATPPGEVVSEGPTRGEFTRTRWLNVGIGLGAIALFTVAFWWARHQAGNRRA
jgi:hypothetical protein